MSKLTQRLAMAALLMATLTEVCFAGGVHPPLIEKPAALRKWQAQHKAAKKAKKMQVKKGLFHHHA